MKRGYRYLLHAFYWFLFFGWRELAGMLFGDGGAFQYQAAFYAGEFLVFMVPFYVNYNLIMEKYFRKNEMAKCWVSWMALLVFFIFFRYFIEEFLFNIWFDTHNYSPGTGIVFYAFDNVYFGTHTILMSIFIWAAINRKDIERERNSIAAERNSAELNLLKSQVNPHFLFNTLNNIYSLVYQKSEYALPAILRLSDLMRFMTTEVAADKIYLSKEIEYIRSYIELESMRTTQMAMIDFAVTGTITNQEVAPMLLIPFIENGFKHGIITDEQCPFTIHITVSDEQVKMFVSNKINPAQSHTPCGTGLGNVRRRLDILYAGRYTLEHDQQADKYICNLTIKL